MADEPIDDSWLPPAMHRKERRENGKPSPKKATATEPASKQIPPKPAQKSEAPPAKAPVKTRVKMSPPKRFAVPADLEQPGHDFPSMTPWQEFVFARHEADVMAGISLESPLADDPVVKSEWDQKSFLREVRYYAASCFLQENSRFIDVNRPDITLSAYEVFRALSQKIYARFPEEAGTEVLSTKAIKEIMEGVVDGINADPRLAFGLFSGRRYMLPGNRSPRVFRNGYWDINTWKYPQYRDVEPAACDLEKPLGAFQDFLDFAVPDPVDQSVLLDWITWSLQHEASKPTWALFLFSEEKGTGKSTILQLLRSLFGEENASAQNGLDGLTGRFPEDILNKKIITLEEVKLTSFSSAGNTLKEYITGSIASVERKHRNDRVQLPLCACIALTSNHRPTWLEGGERRYYIVELSHEGHSQGSKSEEFSKIVAAFLAQMKRPEYLNRLYIELKSRVVSPEFNPNALRQQNGIMRELIADDVNETDAVLEDLLSIYRVQLIPSEEQHLLVKHLRLKSEQDLRSRLKRLGFAPDKRWLGDAQRRIWVPRDAPIENGRMFAPKLSENLRMAVEMGYVWWPLSTVELGWRRLVALHLKTEKTKRPYSAVDQDAENDLISDPYGDQKQLDEETGPYQDSAVNKPYTGGENSLLADLSWLFPTKQIEDLPF